MDLILVGLPGSGKSAVGRRLAARHGAAFIDLDEQIEQAAGRSIPDIFAEDGEAGFRALEREAVTSLGGPDPEPGLRRVVSPGGGAIVDPRNRWALLRGRLAVWLDVRAEVLGQRLRRSPNVRPLVQGGDPVGRVRQLAASRERFYGAASRVNGVVALPRVVDIVDQLVAGGVPDGTTLLRATTPIGDIMLGTGIAADAVGETLRRLEARRAVVVSEPGAWAAFGAGLADRLRSAGWAVDAVMLPAGEDAKRLDVVGNAARELARLRVERRDPLIAIGGGALGDPAGFLAATYLRGVPWIQVPTTLVAQVDSSIGGKTGVDLPEGKNLMGAFHQPAAVVLDVDAVRSLPERQLRAALGEIVKMAALGDDALFATLETEGEAIARGDPAAFDDGALAEVIERAAWAKVEVVTDDEREQGATGGRITLNLGHTVGHALEAADGYATLLHGEAVAYGLRAAVRIGRSLGVTPEARADRIERLLDALELGRTPLPYPAGAVLAAIGADKKHAAGRLRWVLPTEAGVAVRDDVPDGLISEAVEAVLAGADGVAGAAGVAGAGVRSGGRPSRRRRHRRAAHDARPGPPGAEPEPAGDTRARDLRHPDPGRDPCRDRRPGGRAASGHRHVPIQPRGRPHRPAPRPRLRRLDRQRRRSHPHVGRAARRAAGDRASVLGGAPVRSLATRRVPARELPPRRRAGLVRRAGRSGLSPGARGDRRAVGCGTMTRATDDGAPRSARPTPAERDEAALELARIRDEIDALDVQIVELLNRRAGLGRAAGRAKHVAARRAIKDPGARARGAVAGGDAECGSRCPRPTCSRSTAASWLSPGAWSRGIAPASAEQTA